MPLLLLVLPLPAPPPVPPRRPTAADSLFLSKACVVQRRRVATHVLPEEFPFSEPRVHAMVYDPGTGLLKKMDIDFNEYLKELGPIYNLYEPECVVNEDGECVPPEFR